MDAQEEVYGSQEGQRLSATRLRVGSADGPVIEFLATLPDQQGDLGED